jgi:hypothetical protein
VNTPSITPAARAELISRIHSSDAEDVECVAAEIARTFGLAREAEEIIRQAIREAYFLGYNKAEQQLLGGDDD